MMLPMLKLDINYGFHELFLNSFLWQGVLNTTLYYQICLISP